MIKVIWSDDDFNDESRTLSAIELAYTHGINLIPKQTWDDATIELLAAGNTVDAIILDGKGQRKIDSKNEDASHLTSAMGWISEQKGKGETYPVIIFTGYYENIFEMYGDNKDVHEIIRKPDIDKVYNSIKNIVQDAPNLKIKQKYQEAWNIFDNEILDSSIENTLLRLIRKENIGIFEKNDFTAIREILENLLKKFITLNLLPNELINPEGTITLAWALRILNGAQTNIKNRDNILLRSIPENSNPIIPNKHHVGYCFHFVKETTSAFSHDYSHEYGKTTSTACLNALLEILNWSNKLIIERNLF